MQYQFYKENPRIVLDTQTGKRYSIIGNNRVKVIEIVNFKNKPKQKEVSPDDLNESANRLGY